MIVNISWIKYCVHLTADEVNLLQNDSRKLRTVVGAIAEDDDTYTEDQWVWIDGKYTSTGIWKLHFCASPDVLPKIVAVIEQLLRKS